MHAHPRRTGGRTAKRVLTAEPAAGGQVQAGLGSLTGGLPSITGRAAAETTLQAAGLLCAYADARPHRADVSDDVKFSLRYCDNTHIARELGEDPQLAPCCAPGKYQSMRQLCASADVGARRGRPPHWQGGRASG